MALTTASMPPALAILVRFSAWKAAKLHRAPHPASCTTMLCGRICMALTTASMPPALAILVWFSAWEAAKLHRAPHPYCCESLFDECCVIIWMMTDGLHSWTSFCIAVFKKSATISISRWSANTRSATAFQV